MKNKYSIKVEWYKKSKEFVATCPELDNISFLHKNKIKAVKGLEEVIQEFMDWGDVELPKPKFAKLPKPKFAKSPKYKRANK